MKTKPKHQIKLVTLGCSKNVVDSELLMGQIKANKMSVTGDDNNDYASTVIINTCGFINDAKEESIDTILQYTRAKEKGLVEKVYVMGCLSERYRNTLLKEIPEIDGIFGVNDQRSILKVVGANYKKELVGERLLTTPSHYAYLKVSEGCDRQCSFCAIPLIRGKHVSKPEEQILKEAQLLADKGVKELILIAQDLTYYGLDLYKKRALPQLVTKLADMNQFEWIRLHYTYPAGFPLELLDVIKSYPSVCNYIDIPIQHISDNILKSMNRVITTQGTRELLELIKAKLPNAAIRTTLITGYPGETEQDFEELKNFVNEFQFDRLGVFTYSHEENTPAFRLEDDVPDQIKRERADEIMAIQESISYNKNHEKIGKLLKVVIDRQEGDYYIARGEFDSPEIDNEVLIKVSGQKLQVGGFYEVKIVEAESFDIFGKILRV